MKHYQNEYFEETIFSTDYFSIAKAIVETYDPKNVVEFGCGPGHLTRALSKLNVKVDAIDGFSSPDFAAFENITFQKVDLNNEQEVSEFIKGKSYDLAICTEVAEHLDPKSSAHLISSLTSCARVVVFSAAIPNQGGHGHINCQTRSFWHELFLKNNFQAVDTIRKKLRDNSNVAIWYKLNIIDYVPVNTTINLNEAIQNLIASESYNSSLYYEMSDENSKNMAYLNYPLVKQYLALRNVAKKLLKK